MDASRLDGNAAAGILQEVFASEITAASGTCNGCGAVELIGAVAVYARGPGTVLRCRHCDGMLMKLVVAGGRVWVDARGLRTLELRSA